MLPESESANELKRLRLQAVLAEYQALRSEMLQKLHHHLQIYSVIASAVTLMLGWVITQGTYDVLLAIPIFSTALSLRYIWEQNVIVMMGDYLMGLEENVFPNILSEGTADSALTGRWINWEHYFRTNFPKLPLYKPAIEILLVIFPLMPAILFSSLSLLSVVSCISEPVKSHLHPAIHLVALVVYIPMGIIWL